MTKIGVVSYKFFKNKGMEGKFPTAIKILSHIAIEKNVEGFPYEFTKGDYYQGSAKESPPGTVTDAKIITAFDTLPKWFNHKPMTGINCIKLYGGVLYIATTTGLAIADKAGVVSSTKTVANGLYSNNIKNVFKINSNLYVVTTTGINLSTDNGETFSKITTKGLKDFNVHSMFEYENCVICVTSKLVYVKFKDFSWFAIGETNTIVFDTLHSAIMKDDILYIGTNKGVASYDIKDLIAKCYTKLIPNHYALDLVIAPDTLDPNTMVVSCVINFEDIEGIIPTNTVVDYKYDILVNDGVVKSNHNSATYNVAVLAGDKVDIVMKLTTPVANYGNSIKSTYYIPTYACTKTVYATCAKQIINVNCGTILDEGEPIIENEITVGYNTKVTSFSLDNGVISGLISGKVFFTITNNVLVKTNTLLSMHTGFVKGDKLTYLTKVETGFSIMANGSFSASILKSLPTESIISSTATDIYIYATALGLYIENATTAIRAVKSTITRNIEVNDPPVSEIIPLTSLEFLYGYFSNNPIISDKIFKMNDNSTPVEYLLVCIVACKDTTKHLWLMLGKETRSNNEIKDIMGEAGSDSSGGGSGGSGAAGIGYTALKSVSSVVIETGSKVFTVDLLKIETPYVVGVRLRAFSTIIPTDFVEGLITDYTDKNITLDVDLAKGTGTVADWTLTLTGEKGNDANTELVITDAGKALIDDVTVADQRTTLGLGNSATRSVGSTTGTVAAGDDPRFTEARPATAHKTTHATGGTDAMVPSDIGAISTNDKASANGIASLNASSKVIQDPANATVTSGASKIPIADGSGKLDTWISDASTTVKGKVELATDGESAANLAVQANDSRLSNARTPSAHAASHKAGGTDILKTDDIILKTTTKTDLAVGWYTIAIVASGTDCRGIARFGLTDIKTSGHQEVIFYASHFYGNDTSNNITVLNNSSYGTTPIRRIRIKELTTYDGAALQVYIDSASNMVTAFILGDNIISSGWVLKEWIADVTDPGGLVNYVGFTERINIDIDTVSQGGIITYGPLIGASHKKLDGTNVIYEGDSRLADNRTPNDHTHASVGTGGILDHVNLSNKGSNTHAAIDTFIGTKGANNGLASLDGNGKIPSTQIPAVAVTDTFEVSSAAEMVALTAAEKGDIAVRSDENKSYILKADPYSTLSNWVLLKTPTDLVLSVDGRSGVVSLSDLYAPIAKGVTNGDSHDHSGGDGAQIAHGNLSGAGTNTHTAIDTFIGTKAAASGLASLNASSLVVQNPANASATSGASKIPIADGSGKLDTWISTASETVKGIVELATSAETTAGLVVQANDSRLSNARAPTAHTHVESEITLAGANVIIGTSGAVGAAGEIACTAAGRALLDDADAAAQRTTLGLGGAAILNVGTAASTVAAGDDSRMTNKRDPNDHTHAGVGTGGQITHTALSAIGSNTHAAIDTFIGTKATASGLASLDASSLVVQNPANATATKTASKIPIADGSGLLDTWISDASTTVKGKVELATDGETTAGLAVQGNDSRLSNNRAPTDHTHVGTGSGGQIAHTNLSAIGTNTHAAIDTFIGTKAAASGLASLNASSLVVQNPASATATKTNNAIPIASATGLLDTWISTASETVKGIVELATSAETTAGLAVQASDTRLSNARAPTAHKTTHATGGSDVMTPADIGAVSKAGGDTITGSLSVDNLYQSKSGKPVSNLGNPTIAEMALINGVYTNKTWFYTPGSFTFEYTNDGTTWLPHSVSTDEIKRLVSGYSNSNIVIPNGCQKYRIRIRNNSNYVYLDALYMYISTNSNVIKTKINKKRDDGVWVVHTNSETTYSTYPGHVYLSFTTIPWSLSATAGHYADFEILIEIPSWANGNGLNLYNIEIWGGYPAGNRHIYTWDSDKNVSFPANLSAPALYDNGVRVVQTTDSRLADNRTPNDHTHAGVGTGGQIAHTALSAIGSNTHAAIDTFIGTKAAASGLASLNASSLVVQNPANATATKTASKIPIADGSGLLDTWISTASETVKGIVELATSAETTAGLVVQASDTRLSNARAPTAHTHVEGDITLAGANVIVGTSGTVGAAGEIACTAAGRALLDDADASAQRTTLGLGAAATRAVDTTPTDASTNLIESNAVFDGLAGKAASSHTHVEGDIQLSGPDKLIGRVTTGAGGAEEIALTAAGRALLDDADAAAQRTTLGLGGAAILNVGTAASTVAAGDDSRMTNKRDPNDHTHAGVGTGGQIAYSALSGLPTLLALGETSVTAYRGDYGKTAYDHSQTNHSVVVRATKTFSPTANTWYRIATSASGIGRNSGRFALDWALSNYYGTVRFTAACHYGMTMGTCIQQLEYGTFVNGVVEIRIVYHTTFTGNYAYLEVKYNAAATNLVINIEATDLMGWTLLDLATAGSIPGGYTTLSKTLIANITTGTFTKVTVDAEGKVTLGATATPGDIGAAATTHSHTEDQITLSATDKIIGRVTAGAGGAEEITCTAAGRALLDDADAAAQRTTLGLGGAAILNVGTAASTVAAGDDSRMTNKRDPNDHTHAGVGTGGQIAHTALSAIGSNTHAAIDTFIGTKAAASGLASLNTSSLVVQNPANATATKTASKIPIADGSGLLDTWISTASETVKGIVELATSAETTAGLAIQASDTRIINNARAYTATIANISNAGYTKIAHVTMASLSSRIRMSVGGTTGSVVVSTMLNIIVSHDNTIFIESIANNYTILTIKITADAVESFYYIEATINNANVTTLKFTIFTENDEVITFSPASVTGTTIHTHDCKLNSKTITSNVARADVYVGTTTPVALVAKGDVGSVTPAMFKIRKHFIV